MDFIKNLFNPLNKNKKREYKDLSKDSKQVVTPQPSDLLIYARDIAGVQIQKHMQLLNNCKWIRAEYTYPAFDSMNFIYKNKVFSIIIDIQDKSGNSYLPEQYIKRQLLASKQHNLIPCKFPVCVDNPTNPNMNTIKSLHNGWNLFNTETDEEIIPEHLATTEKIELSRWEMRNFAITYLRRIFETQHLKVLSFQDTLEVDPQMWFEDSNGKKCWLIIRCETTPKEKAEKPEKLNEIIRRCFTYDGYFAGIVLKPLDDDKLYRGSRVNIEFNGLEKIHSVL